MTYRFPHYLASADLATPVLKYVWDDTRVTEILNFDSDDLIALLEPASQRAKAALAVAISEWIIRRYQRLSSEVAPYQILDAAWCATIDFRYLQYIELVRSQYTGPVRGPIWCAVMYLVDMFYVTPNGQNQWRVSIAVLTRLAMHVLPNPDIFIDWLMLVSIRLTDQHLSPLDEPFTDLFNEHEEERRGGLVARQAFDLAFDYHIADTEKYINAFLSDVQYATNQYLRSPSELLASGLKHPYRLSGGN